MTDNGRRIAYIGRGCPGDLSPLEFGNKAANLARMASLGVPVPPGFAVAVGVCDDFHSNGGHLPADVPKLLEKGLRHLEDATGLRYGDRRRPLLVSVRSGAPVSMPGLMETLLNVGLNRQTVEGLVFMTGNPRFAWDSYRRLIQSFGQTVFSHDATLYDALLSRVLESEGVPDPVELDSLTLRKLANEFEELFGDLAGSRFPSNPGEQLKLATSAVLRSARGPRVEAFLKAEMLESMPSTAVTVQAMVFGNRGMDSGAGVVFTRNPASGFREMMVDFKFGAQGEDVVSGRATGSAVEFGRAMPEVAGELERVCRRLERDYGDMQDIEFTVQEGKLFILQSRTGKRAPLAALQIAVDTVAEGLLTPGQGLALLSDVDLDGIVLSRVDSNDEPLGRGESASTGVAAGRVALSNESAEAYAVQGPVILLRDSLSPDDLPGVIAAAGVLAARGARTSHAAVVARQMGKVCIVNCRDLKLDGAAAKCRIGSRDVAEGDAITLDGNTGAVYWGEIGMVEERPMDLLATVQSWRPEVSA